MTKSLAPVTERQLLRAAKLYEGFHDARADELYTVKVIAPDPEVALVIGQLHGVSYKPLGEEAPRFEPYFHKFNTRNRPLFACSFDGEQLYILKGGYRFTKRGIVG